MNNDACFKLWSTRMTTWITSCLSGTVVVLFFAVALSSRSHDSSFSTAIDFPLLSIWAVSQWIYPLNIRNTVENFVWTRWESQFPQNPIEPMAVPTVDVQEHQQALLVYLETTFGKHWRRKPLVLRNIWTPKQLQNLPDLSLHGLLQQTTLEIPYFYDARIPKALTPDATGIIGDIVQNITQGMPHKIGSQLLVQHNPHFIQQVAPTDIVTQLFGNFFSPQHVLSSGPWGIIPALTTVPLFVANGRVAESATTNTIPDNHAGTEPKKIPRHPSTGLHCEPIGNVAVQLLGKKRWTFVQPEHSLRLFPAIAKDGRAFFASHKENIQNVPRYIVETRAGDAVWVPTWTWHQVDYVGSDDVSISASLFHFRPLDFISRNPIFAFLSIPAILLEAVGYNTQ